jgi:hypothetical protein
MEDIIIEVLVDSGNSKKMRIPETNPEELGEKRISFF